MKAVVTWDIWVRLGHWGVVGAVAFQFYSSNHLSLQETHATVGTLLLGWVLFRVLWGFWGPEYARFRHFVKGPNAVINSAKKLVLRQSEQAPGHTAIGGLGVILLLGLLGAVATSGLFTTDDIFYDAPLNAWVSSDLAARLTDFHTWAAEPFLLILVGAHVSAILVHQFLMKEPLVPGMVHGRKPHALDTGAGSASTRLKGGALLAVCVLGVWGGVQLLA